MLIKDLFEKDIQRPIQGVVTIGNEDEEQKWMDLEEYVCTDEIVRSFRTFFRKYRESITTPTEKMGVWITGFFGSGKSHFLKILGYILENEEVAGLPAASYFDEKIRDQLVLADIHKSAAAKNKVVLFNIDSKAKSDSKLKNQAIMDIMLRAFNETVGYCGISPWVADMERTLDDEGVLVEFIEKFEELSGKNWFQTRAKALLNRDYLIKSLSAVRGMTEESARVFVDDQTRNYTNTTEDFAKIVNDYCRKNNTRVVFLMDEVGQFIGDNTQLMLNLQTCVEDLGKYCRGKAWVVITSQQELKAMIDSTKDRQQDFSKIQGRFDTRLLLSGANADEVIKRRILEKKNTASTPLMSLYEANSSKLSNLVLFPGKPTWSGYRDAEEFRDVYPFVSYQFELLQKVFESIREHGMSEGKHLSQNERSLLSAFQESAKKCADEDSGLLVPFDSFYSTIEQFIDYDIKTVFANAQKRPTIDPFALRVLRVLFMIKHVKEMPPTIDRLATLMIGNLNEDKAALKNQIYDALAVLEEETLVQKNGEEYDFLTNEEQDVNKQINNTAYNEGEVQRNVSEIIYDKILESNKYRYEGKYDFGLNRYVDAEITGAFRQEYITIKVFTQFSGSQSEVEFGAETIRSNSVVIDLTEGAFIDELIRANKINTFKRNNSATMSAALAEIMSKKSAESSDRLKRAEDIIRNLLKTAPIYINGNRLDIKQKDGRERIQDALKEMVKQDYYDLKLVGYNYPDQRTIMTALNDTSSLLSDEEILNDANKGAYEEILKKIRDDRSLGRNVTVKSLMDHFTKKPYGWRDLDIQGMIGALWKHNALQIFIHENVVDSRDAAFKNDLVRKNNTDTMVIRIKEKISEEILYKVKKIMNSTYSVNLELKEEKIKEGVVDFFKGKKSFLSGLKQAHGSDYAGAKVAADIYKDFDAILRTSDSLTIFNEIIARADDLEDRAETLDQLEAFYRADSNQQKNYKDAQSIVSWYYDNQLLMDLKNLEPIVEKMENIIKMDLPFSKMTELANLVFQAGEAKERVLEAKYDDTRKKLEADKALVSKETGEAVLLDLTADQKERIQEASDKVIEKYENWLGTIGKNTVNLDSYLTASTNTISGFRTLIGRIMSEKKPGYKPAVRSKVASIINYVPVANKKIKSEADIDKALAAIKERLMKDLQDNDEIELS